MAFILGITTIVQGQSKEYFEYFDNGKVKLKGTIDADSNKIGERKGYYSTGQLYQKINYDNGLPNGDLTSYHENGNILSVEKYSKGIQDGESKFYLETRELVTTIGIVNDMLHGEMNFFYITGEVKKVTKYENDKKTWRNANPVKKWQC